MAKERCTEPPGFEAVIVARQCCDAFLNLSEIFRRTAEVCDVTNHTGVKTRGFRQIGKQRARSCYRSPSCGQSTRKLIQRSAYLARHRQQWVTIDHEDTVASQIGMTCRWKEQAICTGLLLVGAGQHVEGRGEVGGGPRHRPADPEPAREVGLQR